MNRSPERAERGRAAWPAPSAGSGGADDVADADLVVNATLARHGRRRPRCPSTRRSARAGPGRGRPRVPPGRHARCSPAADGGGRPSGRRPRDAGPPGRPRLPALDAGGAAAWTPCGPAPSRASPSGRERHERRRRGAVRAARRAGGRVPQPGGRAHARQGPAGGDARGRRPDPVARACPCSRGSSGAARGTSASPAGSRSSSSPRRSSPCWAPRFGDTEAVAAAAGPGRGARGGERRRHRAPTASPTASRSPRSALAVPAARGRVAARSTSPRRSGRALVGAAALLRDPARSPTWCSPRGMGFGDVKLALLMGLYLGWVGWTHRAARWPAAPPRPVRADARLPARRGVRPGPPRSVTKAAGRLPLRPGPGRRAASSCSSPPTSAADLTRTRSSFCRRHQGDPWPSRRIATRSPPRRPWPAWLAEQTGAPSVEVGEVTHPGPVRVLQRDAAVRRHLGRRRRPVPTRS